MDNIAETVFVYRYRLGARGTLATSAPRRDVPDHKSDRDHRRCNGNDSNGGGGDNHALVIPR